MDWYLTLCCGAWIFRALPVLLRHPHRGMPLGEGRSGWSALSTIGFLMPEILCTLRKSIATVSLSGTLPEKLEAAAAVGFDGVEIFENDLLTFDGTPGDVRRIAEGLGLAVTLFQPFRDFEAMPD